MDHFHHVNFNSQKTFSFHLPLHLQPIPQNIGIGAGHELKIVPKHTVYIGNKFKF